MSGVFYVIRHYRQLRISRLTTDIWFKPNPPQAVISLLYNRLTVFFPNPFNFFGNSDTSQFLHIPGNLWYRLRRFLFCFFVVFFVLYLLFFVVFCFVFVVVVFVCVGVFLFAADYDVFGEGGRNRRVFFPKDCTGGRTRVGLMSNL